jgi:hypothetical protein
MGSAALDRGPKILHLSLPQWAGAALGEACDLGHFDSL